MAEILTHHIRSLLEKPKRPTLRSIGHYRLDREHYVYDEFNNHLLLAWVIKGRFLIQTDGVEFLANEGSLFVITPPASLRNIKASPELEFCWITIDGALADRYCRTRGLWTDLFKYDNAPVERINELGEQLKWAQTKQAIRQVSDLTMLLLDSMTGNIMRYAINKEIIKAKTLIHSAIDQPRLSVDWLADQMGMHRKSLYSLFKKDTGSSPQQYIQRVRMNRICRFLKYSGVDSRGAAKAAGYADTAYFTKMFPKLFGKTLEEFSKVPCCFDYACPDALCSSCSICPEEKRMSRKGRTVSGCLPKISLDLKR
ncbi:AraC family transcriptional regulator [Tichowtungia aerotolerans]|uniref:Helix-turn-helix domain-containing protein n=1 Tax=Tichowtungia aerotolerans TaxID=2697043 RepID=A0A6P1MCR0_9BACT|nr:AraC family transcriptional regulator [Tichowtungia aerotolerans]QHI69386.1 helix-turn-helix domain-containing protein [Tichowtungia aerotolerans]